MTRYYDYILGLIPLSLLGFSLGLQAAGLAQTTAITIGGLVSVVITIHALFVNGPVDAPSPSAESLPAHQTTQQSTQSTQSAQPAD